MVPKTFKISRGFHTVENIEIEAEDEETAMELAQEATPDKWTTCPDWKALTIR